MDFTEEKNERNYAIWIFFYAVDTGNILRYLFTKVEKNTEHLGVGAYHLRRQLRPQRARFTCG